MAFENQSAWIVVVAMRQLFGEREPRHSETEREMSGGIISGGVGSGKTSGVEVAWGELVAAPLERDWAGATNCMPGPLLEIGTESAIGVAT